MNTGQTASTYERVVPHYECLDIPLTASADEAMHLLNEPEARGLHIHTVLDWRGVNGIGARVILKRRGYVRARPAHTRQQQTTRLARAGSFGRIGTCPSTGLRPRSGHWACYGRRFGLQQNGQKPTNKSGCDP